VSTVFLKKIKKPCIYFETIEMATLFGVYERKNKEEKRKDPLISKKKNRKKFLLKMRYF
jgi:hypothetical protein